ncbi:hypothetical protein PQQ88_01200 [Paraburkholderia caledonica]|uniref:hypothetical protein n=1 Tax=Paraburkholderia caledonica TaxID=134536 RepID=UPI0038BD1735
MFSRLGGNSVLGLSQYDYMNQMAMNQQAAPGLWPSNAHIAAMLQNTVPVSDPDERLLVLLTEERA